SSDLPAEFALGADQDGAGFGIDEELRHLVPGHPARIVCGNLDDIGRLAAERNLTWPGERRTPVLARFAERAPIDVHLLRRHLAYHRARQYRFDEEVFLQDHLFAGLRAEALKNALGRLAPFAPFERP